MTSSGELSDGNADEGEGAASALPSWNPLSVLSGAAGAAGVGVEDVPAWSLDVLASTLSLNVQNNPSTQVPLTNQLISIYTCQKYTTRKKNVIESSGKN